MYQCLAFLGNKRSNPVMQKLGSSLKESINSGLSLVDIQALWSLRYLAFTEPFMKTIVSNLAAFSRAYLERFEDGEFLERIANDELLQLEVEAQLDVIK